MFSSKKILAASFERGNKMAKNTDLNPTKVLISYDKTLIVYQDQLSEYPEIEGPFNCAGLSDCNTFVYGVSYDNTVSVWATQALLSKRFDPLVVYKENTPKEKMTFYYEGHTYAILFSPLECSITRSRFDERPWDSESVDKRRFEEGQALLKQLYPSDDENDDVSDDQSDDSYSRDLHCVKRDNTLLEVLYNEETDKNQHDIQNRDSSDLSEAESSDKYANNVFFEKAKKQDDLDIL